MRITGGTLCGRRLQAPSGRLVRPTQDRVREAFFSSQAQRVVGARFLDLFAGSGAVGLEAWSRGATDVLMVESHRQTFSVLRRNMAELRIAGDECRGVCTDVERLLASRPQNGAYDIIYADPPYAKALSTPRPGVGTLCERILQKVAKGEWLNSDGIAVLETAQESVLTLPDGWSCRRVRRYGRAKLWICEQER